MASCFKRYYWSYQCFRCFIKSGFGYVGDASGAYANAPTCCGGKLMHAIRGKEVK